MEREIPLTGGRITQGVVRIGDRVHRPQCKNAGFVHDVLDHLAQKRIPFAPQFLGVDSSGREILSFLPGDVPDNLGRYTPEQCAAAARIIRALHDALRDFPGCPDGMTVCHSDLSPCNFTFIDGLPAAVIDWDAAAFGNPLDDLAYAAWMWLDIGNRENSAEAVLRDMNAMLDAYGASDRRDLCARMLGQMARVGAGIFPTEAQTLATRRWTEDCRRGLEAFMQTHPEL
ncbi:MAG: phosphotransferase [Candidatus Faecivicinus sp.]